MTKTRKGTRPISTWQLDRWRRSAAFREIARQSLLAFHAKRPFLPKCGARRRYDGATCQNLPLENGRCRFHGGKTPKGPDWHKIAMPERGEPDGRYERRLAEAAKRKKKRAAVLATMTPEQRQAADAWARTHKPGPVTDRARSKRQRETAAWLATLDVQNVEAPSGAAIDIATFREGLFG